MPASAEGQILRNARATLAIELSLALTIDTAQAEAIIDTSAAADEAPVAVNAWGVLAKTGRISRPSSETGRNAASNS